MSELWTGCPNLGHTTLLSPASILLDRSTIYLLTMIGLIPTFHFSSSKVHFKHTGIRDALLQITPLYSRKYFFYFLFHIYSLKSTLSTSSMLIVY